MQNHHYYVHLALILEVFFALNIFVKFKQTLDSGIWIHAQTIILLLIFATLCLFSHLLIVTQDFHFSFFFYFLVHSAPFFLLLLFPCTGMLSHVYFTGITFHLPRKWPFKSNLYMSPNRL